MLWGIIDTAEEAELTARFEAAQIQSSFLFRNLYRARKISAAVIDQKGKLSSTAMAELIEQMKSSFLPAYASGENDRVTVEHFIKTLSFFSGQKRSLALLERFQPPFSNHYGAALVRDSLALDRKEKLTTAHLRRAVLSALLTPLRQNVGSCFATAPAILVQREQQKRFLTDLYDLLTTCTLKRTFSGVEHVVPICTSWGCGDLRRVVNFTDRSALLSPGLQAALQAAGVSKTHYPKGTRSIEAFLLQALCKQHRVSEKAVESNRIRRRMGDPQEPNIEQLLDLEAQAQAIFKGYTDHALLKVWEFTLASFSDYKVEFYRWNLYASLGFDPEEAGGIGALLYQNIHDKLDQANKEVTSHQQEYHQAFDEARVSQALLRNADNQQRFRTLKAEMTTRMGHAQACRDMTEDSHDRATHLSTLFQFLVDHFLRYFPDYFQEVYDPEMFDVKADLYDDSPAGFRLVYKHGRSDPTLWTPIFDAPTYQKMLTKFFIAIEPTLIANYNWEEGEKEISDLMTLLVQHLQTDEFLSSALQRMARRHNIEVKGDLLKALDKLEKKPWSYTSGGTVHALIKCYYCVEKELTEEKKQLATPMELLIFLLDTLKALPPRIIRPFEQKEHLGLLMYSPQHVFTLRPGLAPFKNGWLDRGFSYTWARDQVLRPGEKFYRKILLDRDEQRFLMRAFIAEQLNMKMTQVKIALTPAKIPLDLPAFRNHLLQTLRPFFSSGVPNERVDGFLRTAFPLFSATDIRQIGEKVLAPWKQARQIFYSKRPPKKLTYAQFYRYLLAILDKEKEKETDPVAFLIAALEKHAVTPPPPLLFADTNWAQFYFAFAVNPGTMGLELWRVDRLGQTGFPMLCWKETFSEAEKSPWGIFVAPEEYRGERLVSHSWIKA
ncbi:MAG: hypothetical protein AAF443_07240 [Chlamydiota bacterium]